MSGSEGRNRNEKHGEEQNKREEDGTNKDKEQDEDEDEDEDEDYRPKHNSYDVDLGRKSLRFQLPLNVLSEESFCSAQSQDIREDDDGYEDFEQVAPQPSVLQYFRYSPLSHSQPRKPSTVHACSELIGNDLFILPVSSSRQLFEVLSHSPTPSDADINLIRATYLRKVDAVREAISNGANVNTYTDKQTPLLIATEIGDDRLVAYLLTVPNINPDFQNNFGQTPLIIAVKNSFDVIIRLLLNHNADVNISDHMGKTPLHVAVFQQRPNMTKLLLAYGADVDKEDCFGERPIYSCAVKKPNMECLVTLLKTGAAVNHINMTGIPLLSRTIMNGTDFSVIEGLVQYGASVNAEDLVSKKTPLHFAALSNNVKIAKFLVRHGADVNKLTAYNFSPLDEANFHNSRETAKFLENVTLYKRGKSEISKLCVRKSKIKNKRSQYNLHFKF